MRFAVSVLMLGYTRLSGLVAYNSETREFEELTTAIARNMIERNQVKGVKWKNNEDGGEFIVDTEGFNQRNIPIKTAVGKFRLLKDDNIGLLTNSMYSVVRVIDTDYRGRLYEIVSNKCARVKIEEEHLLKLVTLTNVAGVVIDENDNISICDGVLYEDRRQTAKAEAVEVKVETMEDLFTQSENEQADDEGDKEKADIKDEEIVKTKSSEKTKTPKKGARSTSKKSTTPKK